MSGDGDDPDGEFSPDGGSDDIADDDLVQVSNMVPRRHRDAASEHTEYGGVSEAVRETYRILANNGSLDEVRLRIQLQQLKNDRDRITSEMDDLDEELAHINERIDQIETRLDDVESKHDRYDDLLAEMDEMLQCGERVFEGHGKVERAADMRGKTPAEVIDELKDRNPDVPDEQFTEATDAWRPDGGESY